MERLKSALHLSIATVQQHITSADPYSPAALLADPTSVFCPASAQGGGGGGSTRSSYNSRGDGGGTGLVSRLQGKQDKTEVAATGGTASDADAV